MRALTTKARLAATTLLNQHGLSSPPVDVERLAREQGVLVQKQRFDDDLSGMAFVKGGRPVIGVNALHHENRQRFSIAHELGHLTLHRSRVTEELHVDRLNRDARSAAGIDPLEIEANAFASELLMPRDWILEAVGPAGDIEDDAFVDALAKQFRVSRAAMANRLASLL